MERPLLQVFLASRVAFGDEGDDGGSAHIKHVSQVAIGQAFLAQGDNLHALIVSKLRI